jgi:hypothetical protein
VWSLSRILNCLRTIFFKMFYNLNKCRFGTRYLFYGTYSEITRFYTRFIKVITKIFEYIYSRIIILLQCILNFFTLLKF